MKRHLIIVLICLAAAGILQVLLAIKGGLLTRHAAAPTPLLEFSEYAGKRSQNFVLYEDGTVICHSNRADSEDACITYKVADAKKTAEALLAFDISNVRREYKISDRTCQNWTIIWTPYKKIAIYGPWRKTPVNNDEYDDTRYKHDLKLWKTLPDEIRQALFRIDEQCQVNGTPWLPKNIEVALHRAQDATETAIPWPRGWPTLKTKGTKMCRIDWRPGEYGYWIYLPSSMLQDLHKILPSQDAYPAISIGGNRMTASYRFPFPGEDAWMTKEGLVLMENDWPRIQKRDLAAVLAIIALLCLVPLVTRKSSCPSVDDEAGNKNA